MAIHRRRLLGDGGFDLFLVDRCRDRLDDDVQQDGLGDAECLAELEIAFFRRLYAGVEGAKNPIEIGWAGFNYPVVGFIDLADEGDLYFARGDPRDFVRGTWADGLDGRT